MNYQGPERRKKQAEWLWALAMAFPTKADEIGCNPEVWTPTKIGNAMQFSIASSYISLLLTYARRWSGLSKKPVTKQTVAAEILFQTGGVSRMHFDRAERIARPKLQKDFDPLVFRQHDGGGGSQKLVLEDAIIAFRKQLSAVKPEVAKQLGRLGEDRNNDDLENDQDDLQNDLQNEDRKDNLSELEQELEGEKIEGGEDRISEGEKEHREQQQRMKLSKFQRDALDYLDWIQQKVRPFLAERDADGKKVDQWGMRQALDGVDLILVGVPEKGVKHAVTMHFQPEIRRALGVTDYDVTTFMPEKRVEGMHAALPYARAVITAGIPMCLVGPKGVGKTTLVDSLSLVYDIPNTAISMSGGKSSADFYGIQKVGGDGNVIESKMSRLFRTGGFVLLDEMDATDENTLLELNRVVANRKFYNKLMGDEITLHDDAHMIAAMNTLGLGADSEYVGRNRQDAAAMDRWAAGRIKLELDETLERQVVMSKLGI